MMYEPKSVENDDVIRIEEENNVFSDENELHSSCIENTDQTPQIVIGGSRSAFQRWIPDDSSSSSGSDSSYSSSSSSSNKSVNTSDTDQDGNAALPVCNIVDTGMDPSNNNISSLEAISSILIADTQVEVIDENDDDVIEGTPLKNNNLGCICHFECQVNRMVLFTTLLCGGMIIAYLSTWIYAFMHDVDDTEIYGPKPNNKVESEALVFLRDQVLSNISNMSHLLNQESPQYQAMQWLADEDKVINRTVIHSTEILSEQEYGMIVDRYVMALFYYSTNGPEWYDSGNFLNTKKHICDWGTITLNETDFHYVQVYENAIGCDQSGNVEAMIFRVNNLEGQIPIELSKYNASLISLYLDGNGLHGSIPSSFEYMSKLRYLRLYANQLTGRLPYLGNMIHMEEFTVAINKLQGSITDLGFEKMISLRNLQLSNNQFSGTIPQTLSALELQSLKVEGNNFTGNMTGICNSSFVPGIFYADCVEKVQCSCCTGCW